MNLHTPPPSRPQPLPSAAERAPAVSLDTLALVEQALAETLDTLRRQAARQAPVDRAALAEYESWQPHHR